MSTKCFKRKSKKNKSFSFLIDIIKDFIKKNSKYFQQYDKIKIGDIKWKKIVITQLERK